MSNEQSKWKYKGTEVKCKKPDGKYVPTSLLCTYAII